MSTETETTPAATTDRPSPFELATRLHYAQVALAPWYGAQAPVAAWYDIPEVERALAIAVAARVIDSMGLRAK